MRGGHFTDEGSEAEGGHDLLKFMQLPSDEAIVYIQLHHNRVLLIEDLFVQSHQDCIIPNSSQEEKTQL